MGADVVDAVRERLARTPGDLTPHRVAEALRAAGRPVGDATVLAVHDALRRDVLGAGPLEPLLRLPGVTDVLVNGPDAVYVDRGDGLERTDVRFPDDAAVRRLAQRLAGLGGRRLDDAVPHVDLRLGDGTRLHAVLAPVARPGTTVSLRVPHARTFTLDELVAAGTLTSESARLVRAVVDARLAFLVTGGTGTGKTTLLAALLALVDPTERLVVVEDSSELRPDHPHVVGLEARPANLEGAGEVALRTLVRQALRMRPDRIVVGEVRGGEVVGWRGNHRVRPGLPSGGRGVTLCDGMVRRRRGRGHRRTWRQAGGPEPRAGPASVRKSAKTATTASNGDRDEESEDEGSVQFFRRPGRPPHRTGWRGGFG
ncbi:TadA family conjugal transfer-associated ATPase [Nocardioides sp. Arc9.136]|uniref:TadA family conjugal transfer-associated ATPase n=1 Tax=Nocardioides sp. Arc9.136 TaxID=2996826 RepID=UPI002666426E|nr:TadA family conjugal transfer-associated ATPase [Nocardioides sp. Arc9.136]WKN48839.1 TadA family conjugal transfer-associated ATPase [Nocardioides sp. Arc9.136]